MKQVFLISGFDTKQNASDDKHKNLRQAISSKGYRVVPVPFRWNHTTVAQYAKKFIDFYQKNKAKENIVIGNSYGAMVAFLTAPETKPDRIILCSLSPFFREDEGKLSLEYQIKRFGKRRTEAAKYLSAKETAEKINKLNVKVTMLYGQLEKTEYPQLVERVKNTARELKNCELIEVPNAPHSFRYPEYIKGIEKIL